MNFTVIFCCYVLLPYFASFVSPPQEAITCNAVFSRSDTNSNNRRSSNMYYKPKGTEEQDPKSTSFMEVITEKIYPPKSVESMENKYFNQKLNHYQYNNANTWRQRYLVYDKYYQGNGVICLWIGTDKEINAEHMQKGLFNTFCEKLNAMCIGIESRGYGESLPHGNTKDENLKYLNSEQALADVAWFIYNYKSLDTEHILPANLNWGVYGTFKQGTLAARMRMKFPHLVKTSLAISAPMIAQVEHEEFFIRYKQNFKYSYNMQWDYTGRFAVAFFKYRSLISCKFYDDFKELFRLCDDKFLDDNEKRKKNIEFMNFTFGRTVALVASVLQYTNQHNEYKPVKDKIYRIVFGYGKYKNMDNILQRFAELIKWVSKTENGCLELRYDIAVSKYKEETGIGSSPSLPYPLPQTLGDRLSLYLRCTEYGHFETVYDFFGTNIKLSFYQRLCHDVFAEQYYPRGQLQRGVRRTNVFYGGEYFIVSKVIFIYGSDDPYKTLGHPYNGYAICKGNCKLYYVPDKWSFSELKSKNSEQYSFIYFRWWIED